jgi:hypothetical protein
LVVGDHVLIVEEDGITGHDALVQAVFLHQAALSPTGMPTITAVYVDAETSGMVVANDLPHKSGMEEPTGKHWQHPWELGT